MKEFTVKYGLSVEYVQYDNVTDYNEFIKNTMQSFVMDEAYIEPDMDDAELEKTYNNAIQDHFNECIKASSFNKYDFMEWAKQVRQRKVDTLDFFDLPFDDQQDLINWYNISENDLNDDICIQLFELFNSGRFKAWFCPHCGIRVYQGNPESWDSFQGVNQVDYESYPPKSEYDYKLCNICRLRDVGKIKTIQSGNNKLLDVSHYDVVNIGGYYRYVNHNNRLATSGFLNKDNLLAETNLFLGTDNAIKNYRTKYNQLYNQEVKR